MHHIQESHGPELDRHFGHLDRHNDGYTSHDRHEAAHALARGLGWASIALGALDLFASDRLARKMGMRGKERLIQAVGVREVVTGLGILAAKNPAPWLWARVAGDAFDLATMATALHHGNRRRQNVAIGMGMVGAIALLDILAAQRMSEAAKHRFLPMVDYSDRSGLPGGVEAARGKASDFEDRAFSTPAALRPWTDGQQPGNGWSEPGGGKKIANSNVSSLGAAVERDTSVFGSEDAGGIASKSGRAPLQQAAGSHERDDAFKTGQSFAGKGNEGP